jgi:hypothetical protein
VPGTPCRIALALGLAAPPGLALAQVDVVVPPVAVTVSDVPLVLGEATFDAVRIEGALQSGDTVTLAASGGLVSLSSVAGITFGQGDGIADPLLSFGGALADVNAALDDLIFEPLPGFAGAASLQISAGAASAELPIAVNAWLDGEAARDALLLGVGQIHSGVQPGYMAAFGPTAWSLSWYEGDPGLGPVMAAASWGAGRVVAMPDHQMANMGTYGADSGVFYGNAIAWLAGTPSLATAIVTTQQGVADWLGSQGYSDVLVTTVADLPASLFGADVLIPPWMGSSPPPASLDAVADFVRSGGGLLLVEYGTGYDWWWGGPIHDAPGNRLLREAGIGFTGGNRWDTGVIDASGRSAGHVDGEALLAMLAAPGAYSAAEQDEGAGLLTRIYDALAPDDPLALRLDDAFLAGVSAINPTPATPVSDGFEQAMLLRETALLEALPPSQVTAHRTAEAVFGAVPLDAPRLSITATVDPAVTLWHSTGAYAAPGEVVTVTVPSAVVGQGHRIRVSGHTDDISVRGGWSRMPRVSRAFDLDAPTIEVASAFGGALYVDVGTAGTGAPFDVTFAGAVEAPRFVLGVDDDASWVADQRDQPAPQAELVCERLAISLPSSMVRGLDDPTAVMEHWDAVVGHHDSVGAQGHLRSGPERINIDVQISAGYLHAGYPTQGPAVAGPELVDSGGLLQSGSWGWYHELGHEAQRRPDKSWGWDNPYTFDGAVEATVNIFSSHAYDAIGQPSRGGWSWTGSRVEVMERALMGVHLSAKQQLQAVEMSHES